MAELAAHSLLKKNTPVQHRGISVCEKRHLGMLRVQYLEDETGNELARRLEIPLPQPGYYTQSDGRRLHWLTPNEYLVIVGPNEEFSTLQTLAPLAESDACHVSVLSDARVMLEVSGERVMDLLAQGCSLDLHTSRFSVGRSTVTRFALLPLMLSKSGETCYELTVDRAYSRYLWDWLIDGTDGI